MSYMNGSLAFELYRPTIDRYAPIVGVFFLVGVIWVAATSSNDDSMSNQWYAPAVVAPVDSATIKAGELDVPVYYFPDAATGTDSYVTVRDSDCGSTL